MRAPIVALALALALAACGASHERSDADGGTVARSDAYVELDAWTPTYRDASYDTGTFDAGWLTECVTGRADFEGETPVGPADMFANVAVDQIGAGDCPGSSIYVRASPGVPSDIETPLPYLWIEIPLEIDVNREPWSGSADAHGTLFLEDGTALGAEGRVVMGSAGVVGPGSWVTLSLYLDGDGITIRGLVEAPWCSTSVCI